MSRIPLISQYNYLYDLAGNRAQQVVTVNGTPTTTNYTYDAANRLQSDGTHSYTYDTAGRLTNDGVNAYTWDRANRLLSYNGTANQYAYDGDGHRVQQTLAGIVTQYVIDVQPGLAKVLSATTGNTTLRYIHDPLGIRQQQLTDALHTPTTAPWQWMIQDGLGSVRGEVDSSVHQQESRLYGPYGEPPVENCEFKTRIVNGKILGLGCSYVASEQRRGYRRRDLVGEAEHVAAPGTFRHQFIEVDILGGNRRPTKWAYNLHGSRSHL